MSEWISYQGKPLGRIKLDDNNTGKLVFVAEDFSSLTKLFKLGPKDKIETEEFGRIGYEAFKRHYLDRVSGFYPTEEAWLTKNYRAKTIDEAEKEIASMRA